MTANHEHTPTTEEIERAFRVFGRTNGPISQLFRQDEFYRWLATVEAAAEQRGAIKALLKATDAIRENRLASGDEHTELCDNCSIVAADHLLDRADRIADQMEDVADRQALDQARAEDDGTRISLDEHLETRND